MTSQYKTIKKHKVTKYNSKTINDNSTNICFEVIKKDGQMKAFDEADIMCFLSEIIWRTSDTF